MGKLCQLFQGATQGVAAAVTLGGEVDRLICRQMLMEPALGAAISALASVLADEEMDRVMSKLQEDVAPQGLTLSPRFSPGYGDLPLTYQQPLCQALESWRIGVSLTQSCLMLPEKSITALCALRNALTCPEAGKHDHACQRCILANCPYREEEIPEGEAE